MTDHFITVHTATHGAIHFSVTDFAPVLLTGA